MAEVDVPAPERWEKEGVAWRAILDEVKVAAMRVFGEERIAVREWREFRWDIPDVSASWDTPDGAEANLHVWVSGEWLNYTLRTEGNKWKDQLTKRRFKNIPGQPVQVEWDSQKQGPSDVTTSKLPEVLAKVVRDTISAELNDAPEYDLAS